MQGVLIAWKNSRRKVRGHFDATLADEIFEVAETQATILTTRFPLSLVYRNMPKFIFHAYIAKMYLQK